MVEATKWLDAARHLKWTGVSNTEILSNLRRLSEAGHEIMIRIPVIPGVNDDEQDLRLVGGFLASLPRLPAVELLPYHNIAEAKYAGLGKEYGLDICPPDAAHMKRCAAILCEYGIRVAASFVLTATPEAGRFLGFVTVRPER